MAVRLRDFAEYKHVQVEVELMDDINCSCCEEDGRSQRIIPR